MNNKDHLILALRWIVFFLLCLGVVQVFSSSFHLSVQNYDNGWFFVKKHIFAAVLGFSIYMVFQSLPKKLFYYFWPAAFILVLLLMCLSLWGPVALRAGGASRWIKIPLIGFNLQPTELLKVIFPFVTAWVVTARMVSPRIKWSVYWLLCVVPTALLLLMQPDFGSLVLITLVCFLMLFLSGVRLIYFLPGLLVGVGALGFLLKLEDYRVERLLAFLNPWENAEGSGFQLIQSLISIREGGFWGKGLGQGQSKLFFLPEVHTDFAFAVLAEETGFFGVSVMLIFFACICSICFKIGLRQRDPFYKLVVMGLTLTFCVSVMFHVAVNLGLLPTKGLGLPFLSYGGSALLGTCLLFGVLSALGKRQF